MSCLGLKIFGYNKSIQIAINQFEAEATTKGKKLEIVCHSRAWTYEKKVTTFVVALLAALLIATGGSLYASGVINVKTAMALMITGGAVLCVDLAAIFLFLKRHMPFVEAVGQNISGQDGCNCKPQNTWIWPIEIGKMREQNIDSDISELHKKILVKRLGNNTYRLEYFETSKLYNAYASFYRKNQTLR